MNRSSIALVLEDLLEFLSNDCAPLIAGESRKRFSRQAGDLLDKALQPSEVLYVGILGGTGVGKSTLINALARKKISDASDRRPFTDRAVVYRHTATPRGLAEISSLLREPDALHDVPEIKELILLDLPDFDSAQQSNRLAVLDIIKFLDAIVWVVSPEKYADAAFYAMVRTTAIRQNNFTFVFNKADELLETRLNNPHGRIKEILGDLIFRLKYEAAVDEPRIFTLSAAKEFSGQDGDSFLAGEFRRFRDFLMARREAKEVASIKTANLAEKVSRLAAALKSEIRPEETAAALNAVVAIDLEPGESNQRSDLHSIDRVKLLADAVAPLLLRADASIAVVKYVMRVLRTRWPGGVRQSAVTVGEVFGLAAEDLAKDRRSRIESVSARINSELLLNLRGNTAAATANHTEETVSRAIDQASASLAAKVEHSEQVLSGAFSRWRRAWQKTVLLVPWTVFVLRLCGEQRVEAWLDDPSLWGLGKLAVSFFTALFGVEGLTALPVLLVFEAILVYFLASRRIKKIERECMDLARSAIGGLDIALDDAMDKIQAGTKTTLATMQSSLNRFAEIDSRLLPLAAERDDASHP